MNVSINWLSALLGTPIDPADAAERLTMLGAPVEARVAVHRDLGDILIALVERVDKHPNADRLSLCQVNTGTGVVEVVCGAHNVRAGAKYPYAGVGTVLPGGLELQARKIRGVVSNGMLCSEDELGLGTDHEGILELHTDAPPGTRLLDAVPLADTRLVLEVTPNRPDLLCHKGVARELAAVLGRTVKLPPFAGAPAETLAPVRFANVGSVAGVEVAVEDVEGCPRYTAAVIRGLEIRPSPEWLKTLLRGIGQRPINNVVDATNYMLFELNQPMHAFDQDKLAGPKIVVRRARAGEKLVTLDGEERTLSPEMTMICDAAGVVAVGGVMGGADSEVTPETTNVVLECAYFDPKRIRATRTALGMSTEASYRYERGTDVQGMAEALRRGVALIVAVAGGSEPGPPADVYPRASPPRTVFLRPGRVSHLLGVDISRGEIEKYLTSIGFAVAPKNDRVAVQVPGWRPDVTREEDLVEEVARLRGYDSFPTEIRPLRPSVVPDEPMEGVAARARRVLTALGLHEGRTISLGPPRSGDAPRVMNPLSADEGYLRTELLGGLVRSVDYNWSVRERDIRLFEVGRVFGPAKGEDRRPSEAVHVAGVVSGARRPPHWSESEKTVDFDSWDVKSLFEEVCRVAGPVGSVEEAQGRWVLRDPDGRTRGWAGEVEADRPAWAAPVYGFEVDMVVRGRETVQARPLPTTPPVERDLALVLPEGVRVEQVERVLAVHGGPLLESAEVFDEYRDEHLAGRSVAWHLVFRAPNRTLRDEDADGVIATILTALEEQLRVVRRET